MSNDIEPELTGRIVLPGDRQYSTARKEFNTFFNRYPCVIVFAQNTQDVVNAVIWARNKNRPFRVRSGRHNYEGLSVVDNGLVIDVSNEYYDYNLVVAQANGRPCEGRIIEESFQRLKAEAGLPNVVFHSLRHSSTTYKLKLNHGDLKATQGDTGHAELDMITKIYAHILDEDRKINAQKFEASFYSNPDLRKVKAPPETTSAISVTNLASLVEQLQKNPELANALAGLLGAQNPMNLR